MRVCVFIFMRTKIFHQTLFTTFQCRYIFRKVKFAKLVKF